MPTKTDAELKREILEEEARHASAIDKLEAKLRGPDGPIKDHEDRLRNLEKWQGRMMGIGTCVSLAMAIFIGVCTWTVTTGMAQVLERIERAPLSTGKR